MSSDKLPQNRPCPICAAGVMAQLTRIVHGDNSITTYWRCAACSHVEVRQTELDDDAG